MTETKAKTFLPPAVATLLKSRWQESHAYTNNIDDPGRKDDPSGYWYEGGRLAEFEISGITSAEAFRLHEEGAFGPHSSRVGQRLSVNEHALHALLEFLGEASAAWVKYQQRLEEFPHKNV